MAKKKTGSRSRTKTSQRNSSLWGKIKALPFSSRFALLVLAIIITTALGTIGYLEWDKRNTESELKASAGAWTKLSAKSADMSVYGCKITDGSTRAGFTEFRVLFVRNKHYEGNSAWLPETELRLRENIKDEKSTPAASTQRYWYNTVSMMAGAMPNTSGMTTNFSNGYESPKGFAVCPDSVNKTILNTTSGGGK